MHDNFFDTSALKHHYIVGQHTRRVRLALGRSSTTSQIADVTILEMPSAFAQVCRSSGLGLNTFDKLYRQFLDDVARGSFSVRVPKKKDIQRAIHLIRFAGLVNKKGLKSSDALIAATALDYALEVQRTVNFYTSDWPLYLCLRELNAFRTTMNLYLLGTTKDGTEPVCRRLAPPG